MKKLVRSAVLGLYIFLAGVSGGSSVVAQGTPLPDMLTELISYFVTCQHIPGAPYEQDIVWVECVVWNNGAAPSSGDVPVSVTVRPLAPPVARPGWTKYTDDPVPFAPGEFRFYTIPVILNEPNEPPYLPDFCNIWSDADPLMMTQESNETNNRSTVWQNVEIFPEVCP